MHACTRVELGTRLGSPTETGLDSNNYMQVLRIAVVTMRASVRPPDGLLCWNFHGMPCKTGCLKFKLSDPFMIGSFLVIPSSTCSSKIG